MLTMAAFERPRNADGSPYIDSSFVPTNSLDFETLLNNSGFHLTADEYDALYPNNDEGLADKESGPSDQEPRDGPVKFNDYLLDPELPQQVPASDPTIDTTVVVDQQAGPPMFESDVPQDIGVLDPLLSPGPAPNYERVDSGLDLDQQVEPLAFGTNGPQYDQQTYPAMNQPLNTYYFGTNGWPTTPLSAPSHHLTSYPTAPYSTTGDQMNYWTTTLQTTAPLTTTPCFAMPSASNSADPQPESPPRCDGKRAWVKEEDDCLKSCSLIQTEPGKKTQWKEVEKYMRDHGHDRDSKQCREHWINYADPRLVERAWYEEERNKQGMMHYCTNGQFAHNWQSKTYPKWAAVEEVLEADATLVPPGRKVAPNKIKNFYHGIQEGKDFKARQAGRPATGKRKRNSNSRSGSDKDSQQTNSSSDSTWLPPDTSPPDGSPSGQRHPDDDDPDSSSYPPIFS